MDIRLSVEIACFIYIPDMFGQKNMEAEVCFLATFTITSLRTFFVDKRKIAYVNLNAYSNIYFFSRNSSHAAKT